MRRLLIATAVALLLAVPSPAGAQEDTLGRIKRIGAITIGYTETSAPFSSVGPGGTPQGYSIDLCLRVAENIKKDLSLAKLDVKWVKVTAENRIAFVVNGTVDIECGTTTKTLSRMQQVDFTALTFLDGGSLLVTTASGIGKIADLPGKRVAVIPTTTTERAMREVVTKLSLQNVTLLSVKDHAEGLGALDDGKVDAYASDRTLLASLARTSKSPAKLALLEAFISYEPYAFMIRRGDTSFRFTVDRVLIRLYRSAEVVPIYEKWFGPFPEGTSMIAALYVLNSVPE
jgi:glutamate/aspartate transport system substrate-binding protein